MDTTTVNFAINKLSEGWQKVAPTIKDVGTKYVEYTVTKAVIWAAVEVISIALFIWFVVYLWKKIPGWVKTLGKNDNEPILIFLLLPVGVGAIIVLVGLGNLLDGVLAITNPEMFTIHELIKAVK